MATAKTAQQIDLANYAEIARRMFPASRALAICDCSGSQQAGSDDAVEGYLQTLRETAPDWPDISQGLELIATGSNDAVLVMTLQSATSQVVGFLLWWVDDTTVSNPSADLHDTLVLLGTSIRAELELNSELDSMATELSERYEELNLVYNTEDQVNYFREGHEAFRGLTKNCADYLNAGVAVLYLRDKGLFISSHSDAVLDNTDVRLIRSALDDYLYDQVIDNDDVQFLNNDRDDGSEATTLPYRIMVGTLSGFAEHANGVLLIAKLMTERPFSNSDKNLLSVMSRKAAKIVQASYDGLTGLINRTSFQNLVEAELAEVRSNGGHQCCMHLNIDQLHRINETLGHEAGDMVIRAFAAHIAGELRECDWVARLGGDEIGILVQDCGATQGQKIAANLLADLAALEMDWQGERLNMTASIGLAILNESSNRAEQVLKNAVVACDTAKENGGNQVNSYGGDDTSMRQREASMWMVSTVHNALREDLFRLYAQPIEPLKPGGKTHLEILLRMQNDDEILAPNAFMPASERYRLMSAIDEWVITKSLWEIARFLDTGPVIKPVFGINLSGQSFSNDKFLDFLQESLLDSGVPGELICFEITETAAVSDVLSAQKLIATMHDCHCKFALDDFGAGLSSFAYLKSFDVDYLKIDGVLVKDIADDRVSAAMVESVTQIAHVMGLETIAEFVETAQVKHALARMGVDYAQGYLLGKPAPLRQQLELLQSQALARQDNEDTVPTP